jgi:NADH-quinone oxidoreductase subunit C
MEEVKLLGKLKRKFKKGVEAQAKEDIIEAKVELPRLLELLAWLKSENFNYFSFVTAVDRKTHFELFYHLANIESGEKVLVRTEVEREDSTVPSVVSLWKGADWQEREVYDLFGITFEGHPNLKRILLPEDWEGFPLRKDYEDPDVVRRPEYF